MKVLIDISEESYNFAKECKSKGSSKYDWGLTYNNTVFMIANGTPIPDNATNGDMIKAMFPNVTFVIDEERDEQDIRYSYVYTDDFEGFSVDLDWWDAPYKRGSENV